MMTRSTGFAAVATIAATLLVAAPAVRAHHSFGAEFDFNKPVTLHGICVKWEMINPHSYLTVDVKNDDGTVTEWSVQAGAPSFLYRNGWRKDSVKPGDELIITGYSAEVGHVYDERIPFPVAARIAHKEIDAVVVRNRGGVHEAVGMIVRIHNR